MPSRSIGSLKCDIAGNKARQPTEQNVTSGRGFATSPSFVCCKLASEKLNNKNVTL